MEEQVLNNLINSLANQIDDKLRDACLLWGVNVEDRVEMKARCEIITHPHNDRNELIIDGKLVMVWGPWKFEPMDLNEPFKMSASFLCSEIQKP